jgi:hypothetical protein
VLIAAKKIDAGVRGCSNATRSRISKGSLPSAGVMLGGFESDGHKKHHKTGWCFRIFSMFPPKKSWHHDHSTGMIPDL